MPTRPIEHVFASAMALTLFAVPASAQNWTKHVNQADGFEVEFSGAMKANARPLDADRARRVVRETFYIQDSDQFVYLVIARLEKATPDLEIIAAATFGASACKEALPDTPVTVPAGRAIERRGSDCGGPYKILARYYAKGNWVYAVMAQYSSAGEESATRFVQSFKMLEQ